MTQETEVPQYEVVISPTGGYEEDHAELLRERLLDDGFHEDVVSLRQFDEGDDEDPGSVKLDRFDAKDKLGFCPPLSRKHRETDVYKSTDGEKWKCFHCDNEVPVYV